MNLPALVWALLAVLIVIAIVLLLAGHVIIH